LLESGAACLRLHFVTKNVERLADFVGIFGKVQRRVLESLLEPSVDEGLKYRVSDSSPQCLVDVLELTRSL
jgi:hypothetical protein